MKKYTKIGIKLLSFFLTATFFAVTERLPVLSTVQNTGGCMLMPPIPESRPIQCIDTMQLNMTV